MIKHMQINIHNTAHKQNKRQHIIISIDAEKAFEKLHHLFMTKALKKLVTR
jgi:hypothetical protein